MRNPNKYDWMVVVAAFMASTEMTPVDSVLVMDSTVDKQAEAIMAQYLAQAWGLA